MQHVSILKKSNTYKDMKSYRLPLPIYYAAVIRFRWRYLSYLVVELSYVKHDNFCSFYTKQSRLCMAFASLSHHHHFH